MKISTSTGDFKHYTESGSVASFVRELKNTKFRYINLEQTSKTPEFCQGGDEGWRRLAQEWGEAAADAGVTYVVSHAPCLDVFQPSEGETYETTLRAIRRSIEVCGVLNIPRIVVHASSHPDFTYEEFIEGNKRFYGDLFDTMERLNVMVLIENMHDQPQPRFSTGAQMRDFLEEINHPLLGACWDTAHWNLNQTARAIDQYDHIVALGKWLKGLHISDNLGGVNDHHHSWPFAGTINFDAVMQGLLDVEYDGYFNFEASYTLLHNQNPPHRRRPWIHNGETVTKLLAPTLELKRTAVDLLYDVGKYMLETYDCFEE